MQSLAYYNEKLAKSQTRVMRLELQITGTVTVSPVIAGAPVLTTFGAISAQSTIDNFLGTTSEFDYLAFDATSMGNDAMGGIVNMGGQAAKLSFMKALCYSATAGSTLVERAVVASSALTATSLVTECAKGANGNLAFKVDWGNTPDFDALTSGLIVVELYWVAK